MKRQLLLLSIILTLPATLPALNYETGFEDFSTGEIHGQNLWSGEYDGSSSEYVTIVDGSTSEIPPPEGNQMLHLIRPTLTDRTTTGIIFHRGQEKLLNFDAEFQMAYIAKSKYPIFQFQIGSAAGSETGVTTGIAFFDDPDGTRNLHIFHGAPPSSRTPTPQPGKAPSTEPYAFYKFHLHVHGEGTRFDLTVTQNGKTVATIKDQEIPKPAENYNRLLISIPGGNSGDQLFLDDLRIQANQ